MEDDVDVWRYAILELHARNDDDENWPLLAVSGMMHPKTPSGTAPVMTMMTSSSQVKYAFNCKTDKCHDN